MPTKQELRMRAEHNRMVARLEDAESEHDKRVEEYRELERMLPNGIRRSAIRVAIKSLADTGKHHVAALLSEYLRCLEAAGL